MKPPRTYWTLPILFAISLLAGGSLLPAFGDEGALDTSQPKGITPDEIIQKFTSKEKEFKQALDQYGYRESVKLQTLEGDTVDGEFQEVFDISFDDKGRRVRNMVFAPQPTLQRISMSREDLDDMENGFPLVLTSDQIAEYTILYVGQQQEDELHCYAFDIAPKTIEKNKRYFQGRIWVDDRDFQIVKSYGRMVPETRVNKKGRGNENLFPQFTTYRGQIDNKYWFPVYTRADDTLHFNTGDVKIRQVVKYTDYKYFGAKSKITFNGQELPKTTDQPATPQSPSK